MNKKQFDYLKSIEFISSHDSEKHEKALGLEEDELDNWLDENCADEVNAFDSPGMDVDVYLFIWEGDYVLLIYNAC